MNVRVIQKVATLTALYGLLAMPLSPAAAGLSSGPVAPASPGDCQVLSPELAAGRFQGACQDGLAHGQGVVHMPGQSAPAYIGGFERGLRAGYGHMHYPNGDRYLGHWQQDERTGLGEYRFGPQSPWSGDRYNGQWRANRFDGHGRYTWAMGESYDGPWQAGQQRGPSTPAQARRQAYVASLLAHLPHVGYRVCPLPTQTGLPPQGLVRSVLEDRLLVETHPDQPMTWQLASDWRPCNVPSPQH